VTFSAGVHAARPAIAAIMTGILIRFIIGNFIMAQKGLPPLQMY
jgi:hypothetical protein